MMLNWSWSGKFLAINEAPFIIGSLSLRGFTMSPPTTPSPRASSRTTARDPRRRHATLSTRRRRPM